MSTPVVPISKDEMVQFVVDHLPTWEAKATTLGLGAPQITAMKAARDLALTNQAAVTAARLGSKAATGTFTINCTTLRALTQQAVDRIRYTAITTNNPDIYSVAQIPAPQPPTPTPAPETPTDVSADPNADGTVSVRWKGTASNGQFFTIWRRIGENGTWSQVGSIAGRTRVFTDDNVPNPFTTEGASLFYKVLAQRGSQVSDTSNLGVIQYGAGPGFAAMGMKMAA